MPRSYFIIRRDTPFANRGVAKIVTSPNFDGDWHGRYFPCNTWETVDAVHRFEQVETDAGPLWFDAELAGPDGVSVIIYAEPDSTPEQIEQAKRRIRHQRDVVRLSVFRITAFVAA
jgi:hypothetical protein